MNNIIFYDSSDLNESPYYFINKQSIKWIPNDNLVERYNKYINTINNSNDECIFCPDVNKALSNIRTLENKIDHYNKIYAELSKSESLKKKSEALEYKLFIYDLEMEVCGLKSNIQSINKKNNEILRKNDEILNEWSEYLNSAKKFIMENKLYDIVTVKNIISTHNLLIVQKKNIDSLNVCITNLNYNNNLIRLNQYFNLP